MASDAVFESHASPTIALPFVPRSCCAAATELALRPTTMTREPSFTNAFAAESPIPVVPPITTSVLPARRISVFVAIRFREKCHRMRDAHVHARSLTTVDDLQQAAGVSRGDDLRARAPDVLHFAF